MASIESCIITITQSNVLISRTVESINASTYLKIHVLASEDGQNISCIEFWYMNPNNIVSRLHEEITDSKIYNGLSLSLVHDGMSLLQRILQYITILPDEDHTIIKNEYKKYIVQGSSLDGLICGIAAYFVFIALNELGVFVNQMPFQFTCPWALNSGYIINQNMFQYLTLPLITLSKINMGSNQILSQLTNFIYSFINMWSPCFIPGPSINITNETHLCTEIMTGLAQHNMTILERTQSQNDLLLKSVQGIELRLQNYVDTCLTTLKREIHNFIIDSKTHIDELNSNARIESLITTQFTSKIEPIVTAQIEPIITSVKQELNTMIKEEFNIVKHELAPDTHNITSHSNLEQDINTLIDSNNEFYTKLVGLEHRVEVLYNMK